MLTLLSRQTKKVLNKIGDNVYDVYLDEKWKNIPGYPNYEISNFGRVYNVQHNRFLKPFYKFGYEHVGLYKDGKSRDIKIHRLVAEAFMTNFYGFAEINHLDGDKTYNYVENLEWSTRSENMLHAYRTGLKIATNKRAVRIIETDEIFESLTACADSIGGYPGAIRYCLTGKLKSHRGLTFEYVTQEAFE